MTADSKYLVYQRIRNRVIELLEMYASLECVAQFGAFGIIEMHDDFLPIEFSEIPDVFTTEEQAAIANFTALVEQASAATITDTSDLEWLVDSEEWWSLSVFSKQALKVFIKRGRYEEQ